MTHAASYFLLQREPLRSFPTPRGVRQHRMNVKLRVKIATRVVNEHRADKVSCQSELLAHRSLAASFASRRVAFHFGKHCCIRRCTGFASSSIVFFTTVTPTPKNQCAGRAISVRVRAKVNVNAEPCQGATRKLDAGRSCAWQSPWHASRWAR